MKLSKQSDSEWFGRFEENEEIIVALTKFCEENNIQTGWFSIIGGVKKSVIAFYDRMQKKYLQMPMDEFAEILHCSGNIALKEGKPFIHSHIVLGAKDGTAYGGHLMAGKVFAAEIYIKKFDKTVERKMDENTGLGLLEV